MLRRSGLPRTSVLLVDADPVSSAQTARLVSEVGFDSVWRARSVERALRFCTATPFDVAIIDLKLGERDGADLIIALRAWPGSVGYVLAMALDGEQLARAVRDKLPADGFLQKPIHRHALVDRIGGRVQRAALRGFDVDAEQAEID